MYIYVYKNKHIHVLGGLRSYRIPKSGAAPRKTKHVFTIYTMKSPDRLPKKCNMCLSFWLHVYKIYNLPICPIARFFALFLWVSMFYV